MPDYSIKATKDKESSGGKVYLNRRNSIENI